MIGDPKALVLLLAPLQKLRLHPLGRNVGEFQHTAFLPVKKKRLAREADRRSPLPWPSAE